MSKVVAKFNIFITISLLLACFYGGYASFRKYQDYLTDQRVKVMKSSLKETLHSSIAKKEWPKNFDLETNKVKINYTFNQDLTRFIKKKLKRYRPDYASVVVIDNDTGAILSALDYSRKTKKFGKSLTFSSTHPAASIFKVVTAAELLENTPIKKDTRFNYRGRSTTLYRYQLKNKKTRWTRTQNLKQAFAISNNVIFGKAAINNINSYSLYQTAIDFGFNVKIMPDFDLPTSILKFPEGQYNLAEISSGFNRETLISPIHGAAIASVIANDGVRVSPHLVKNTQIENEMVWSPKVKADRVLEEQAANDLQELMNYTVKRGTARSAFRRLNRKWRNKLEIGGKTGSITGGVPHGKRDWFIAYAMPKEKDSNSKGISLCVMMVNVKKWYVKSTVLSSMIIDEYFKNIKSI